MIFDMPPQIPPAVIEYVKEHDYLPDRYKNINKRDAYQYIRRTKNYKGYRIYQLGYFKPYDYFIPERKNCYFILHNSKDTKCASKEESEEIVRKYPKLSPTGIPQDVVDYVREYGNVPKNLDNYPILAEIMEDNGINPDELKEINIYNAHIYISYTGLRPKKYKYYLGFPYVSKYEKNRCQILVQSKNKIRCVTEKEFLKIMQVK
jgi:hypothetical protein